MSLFVNYLLKKAEDNKTPRVILFYRNQTEDTFPQYITEWYTGRPLASVSYQKADELGKQTTKKGPHITEEH